MKAIKEKMAKRPVLGMTIYSGSPAVIDIIGRWGLDFAFIDAEHTAMGIDTDMEKLVMAAKLSGVSPLVRVTKVDDIEIRKALEMGADGVIIPHVRTLQDAKDCVKWAKFPPKGRRGIDATVRAAQFAAKGFNYDDYLADADDCLVIPMAEDYEFMDDIDAILDVPGLDVINFGPADFALSKCMKTFYNLAEPEIQKALQEIVEKSHKRGIKVMAPVIPPTADSLKTALDAGVDMLIMGSDMLNLNRACAAIMDAAVEARVL
ncbi:MAG: aldolase/citrate lyase family protein [Planctomycetaceae bacterium]|nr:aldolase/citrate lyase family protein [Planctomycetaceae bacterium]